MDAAIAQAVFLRGHALGRADAAAALDALDAANRAQTLASTPDAGAEVRTRAADSLAATQVDSARARRAATMIRSATFAQKGGRDAVIAALREITKLLPACAEARHQLAMYLNYKLTSHLYSADDHDRDVAEIESEYRKAIELDPADTQSRYEFIQFLESQHREPDEQIVQDEELIRLDPMEPAWLVLGFDQCVQRGKLDDAERIARAAAALDPDETPLLPRLEKLRETLDAADGILRGAPLPDAWKGKPWDVVEGCIFARRYATAARIWKSPALGLVETNTTTLYGMGALRIAALRAGLGDGTDADGVSDDERARFRRLSLEGYRRWMSGAMGQGAPGDGERPGCSHLYLTERTNVSMYPDRPGGYSEEELLPKMPADERDAWRRFFADVARIVADPRGQNLIWQATRLGGSARLVLVRRDATALENRKALADAENAVTLLPGELNLLSILGAAHYRTGDFAHAVETLDRCDAERSGSESGAQPADVAFLAMSFQRLGRPADASACLARLRELMAKAPHADDSEAQSLLAEAVELVEGAGGK